MDMEKEEWEGGGGRIKLEGGRGRTESIGGRGGREGKGKEEGEDDGNGGERKRGEQRTE